jgi:FkbM family methyltransferase
MTHLQKPMNNEKIFNLFDLETKIQVMDVGAACINEIPIYKVLLDKKIGHLTAFDGDERHIEKLNQVYGSEEVSIFNNFLFDGKKHEVFLCSPASGMSSLFKPKVDALNFFNGFDVFGKVERVEKVQTHKLDSIKKLKSPDFLKMDVQGAELEIIKNGKKTLKNCLAMQLEVSYFSFYENEPTFGEVDTYMRHLGFVPHSFLDIKRWSIAPTIFNNNFRVPGNQLIQSDIVYVKDPLKFADMSDIQLKKLTILMHYCFKSIDFSTRVILEMEKRRLIEPKSHIKYLENINQFV